MLIDFFGATEIRNEHRELTTEHNEKVAGYELGKLHLPGYEVGLYEFEIKSSYRIGLNRVGLRSLVKSYINYEVDAALVVYYDDNEWRLSFICNLRDEKTAPKRFTYLLGHAHETYRTPIDRFLLLQEKGVTFENIYEAFSVEKLSTAFFDGYIKQFKIFCNHLGCDEKWERDYVKKLLGRLVFLQFLQKKGWLGVPANTRGWCGGDRNFMSRLIDRYDGAANILSDVLEPLFFDTLNTRRDGDIADPRLGEGIKIPYLNGGLFDRSELDTHHRVEFPHALFKGLMEFFSSYNFTIDENDPDDSDVGIDPEMLGHIFENLLEDNKDKGTIYTPKEVVQYMSRQSLIRYLHNHTDDGSHAAVDSLILEDKTDGIGAPLASKLDVLLKNVKICDPAIGSGAFPMGLLSEIYRCRRRLYAVTNSPETFSPATVKREIIQNNIYGVDIEQGAVDIARLRFWLALVVDEHQPEPLPNLDYKIMQGNSLLESYAGIPLDKLEDIIVRSVTPDLFSPESIELSVSDVADLADLQQQYFSETDHGQKSYLQRVIEEQVTERIKFAIDTRMNERHEAIIAHKRQLHLNSPASARRTIKRLEEEYVQLQGQVRALNRIKEGERPYFLWHTYFKDIFEQGGFDIVIGNPPYIQLQNNSGLLAEELKEEKFKTFARTGDIYCLFYEKGLDLLKEGGIETFITSSKWMRAAYGEKLRSYLSKRNPVELIELGPGVFDNATVDTNILIVGKTANRSELRAGAIKGKEEFANLAFQPLIAPEDGSAWIIKSPIEQSVDAKIQYHGTPLRNWDIEIYRGVLTGYNNAFIIDGAKRAELIAEDPKSEELIKPLLRGRGIDRYVSKLEDLWIIFIPWHFPLHKDDTIKGASLSAEKKFEELYAGIYKFLTTHKAGLEQRNQAETGIRYEWYAMQRCAATYYEELSKEKIVWKRIGSILRFCYDDTGSVVLDSTCFSSGPYSKYLTAVLNSKMGNYLLKDAPKTGTGDLLISVQALEPIAIPMPSNDERKPFEELLDEIICLKKADPAADTLALETKIDRMVYELYGLTSVEIDVVEGRTPPAEPSNDQPMSKEYDFFISHASEDKQDVVRKLAKALQKADCKVWYDEFELKIGDSLRKKIDHGLANSRYGIVVISHNFMTKNWPEYELNGMMAREIDGVKVILPLWHGVTKKEVVEYSPSLADKVALDTSKHSIPEIVDKLKEVLEEYAVVEPV